MTNLSCYPIDFSSLFKKFRSSYGFSQTVLAEILSVSRNTVSDIECCKSYPSGTTAASFIVIFGIMYDFSLPVNRCYFDKLLSHIDDLCILYFNYGDLDTSESLHLLRCDLDFVL